MLVIRRENWEINNKRIQFVPALVNNSIHMLANEFIDDSNILNTHNCYIKLI
jgi:hypothetical protein